MRAHAHGANMIPLLFSFQAVDSLIPIILIILLIAGAAGLMRGADIFSFFGFGAVLGFTKEATGKGSLAKKKYMGGGKSRGRLKGGGKKIFGKNGAIDKIKKNAKVVITGFNKTKTKQQSNAMEYMKNSEQKRGGVGGSGGSGGGVGGSGGSGGIGGAALTEAEVGVVENTSKKTAKTATPLNVQIMKDMRERQNISLTKKINMLNARIQNTNAELNVAKEAEEKGSVSKFKIAKGIIFKTQTKNGKVKGYKPIFPVYKGNFVEEAHPLAAIWPVGGLMEGALKTYTKIRTMSPSYKRRVGSEWGSLLLESEGLKAEINYAEKKRDSLNIKKFKNENILKLGKPEFNKRWKAALKAANEEDTSLISNLLYAGSEFRDIKTAIKKRAAIEGGNVLRAPGIGKPSWSAQSAYNMDVSGAQFKDRIGKLNSDIDVYKAARAETKNIVKKFALNEQIRGAEAEKKYAQNIVNTIDKGSSSKIGLVTSSFKLALIGRMYGPHVNEVQKNADNWSKKIKLPVKTCPYCGAVNNENVHVCARCGKQL